MPTVDLEIYDAANKFIDTAVNGKKPFFVWFNTTRMHVWTHLKPSAEGRTGIGLYPDGMVEHDDMVGGLLKRLDELGIADNTIVVYGTDNGAEEAYLAGRRNDAVQGREGHHLGRRLSRADARALAGRHQAGHDRQRNLLAGGLVADAAGGGGRAGHRRETEDRATQANGKTWKVHADGYNFLPYFKGEAKKGPREEIFYFGQGGDLNAIRWNDWKVSFATEDGNIATAVRNVPGWPVITNLRADPYERASSQSGMYIRWYADNIWLFVPVQQKLKAFLTTLPEYPFQQGSSLNAAGINYNSLQAMQAMKRLKELESLRPPND